MTTECLKYENLIPQSKKYQSLKIVPFRTVSLIAVHSIIENLKNKFLKHRCSKY